MEDLRKEHEEKARNKNDWSWAGPQKWVFLLSAFLFSVTWSLSSIYDRWNEKENSYLELISRLQARIYDLENQQGAVAAEDQDAALTDPDAADSPADSSAAAPPVKPIAMI